MKETSSSDFPRDTWTAKCVEGERFSDQKNYIKIYGHLKSKVKGNKKRIELF